MRLTDLTPSEASALAASQRVLAAMREAEQRRASFQRYALRTASHA